MDLDQLRHRIDCIDKDILDLFCQRQEICADIGEFKRENGLPIYAPNREAEKRKAISAQSPFHMADYTQVLFMLLMNLSRSYQNRQSAVPNELYKSIIEGKASQSTSSVACSIATTDKIQSSFRNSIPTLFPDATIKLLNDHLEVIHSIAKGTHSYGLIALGGHVGMDPILAAEHLLQNKLYICHSVSKHLSCDQLVLISKGVQVNEKANRSCFLLYLPRDPGALFQLFSRLCILNIPVTKCNVGSDRSEPEQVKVFIEIHTEIASKEFLQFIYEIPELCIQQTYLGSYCEGE